MRRSPQAELRYWSDELPQDLAVAAGSGLLAGLVAAPLGYFAAMRFFLVKHTLEISQQQGASIFLGLLAFLSAGGATAVLVLLFRYFRRLYRFPL